MRFSLVLLTCLSLSNSLFGLPSASDLTAKIQLFSASSKFQLSCRLTIDDGTSDLKIRELKIFTVRKADEERFLAQVTTPNYLKNLKFLRISTKDGIGTWLKTTKGVQRLSSGGDPEPLFGSDFTTADFQPGSKDWQWATTQPETTVILERSVLPRMGWVKQVLTLREADLMLLKSEFFNQEGILVRRYWVTDFSPSGRPQKVLLEDLKNNRHSELTVLQFDDTTDIAISLFSPGSL